MPEAQERCGPREANGHERHSFREAQSAPQIVSLRHGNATLKHCAFKPSLIGTGWHPWLRKSGLVGSIWSHAIFLLPCGRLLACRGRWPPATLRSRRESVRIPCNGGCRHPGDRDLCRERRRRASLSCLPCVRSNQVCPRFDMPALVERRRASVFLEGLALSLASPEIPRPLAIAARGPGALGRGPRRRVRRWRRRPGGLR